MTKAKGLKIIAELILVLSFLTQTLLFDYYNDKSNELGKSFENRALIDKGAELKEIKYFIAHFPQDSVYEKEYQRTNLSMAAYKIALSQMMEIISIKGNSQEEIDQVNKLFIKANSVTDFHSYSNFIDIVNSQSLDPKEITNKIEDINSRKKIYRFIFIGFYILGTIILIYSSRLEKS